MHCYQPWGKAMHNVSVHPLDTTNHGLYHNVSVHPLLRYYQPWGTTHYIRYYQPWVIAMHTVVGAPIHCALLYQPWVGSNAYCISAPTTLCIATTPWVGSNAQYQCTDYIKHYYQPWGKVCTVVSAPIHCDTLPTMGYSNAQ